jgi:hypothetical protein
MYGTSELTQTHEYASTTAHIHKHTSMQAHTHTYTCLCAPMFIKSQPSTNAHTQAQTHTHLLKVQGAHDGEVDGTPEVD